MAKKGDKISSGLKKLVDDYKDKLLLLAVSFFETKAKNVMEWLKDIGHLKKKLRAIVLCAALMVVGLFVVVLGIADYVSAVFPQLAPGVGNILVGVIIILVAYLIKKLS